MFQWLGQLWTQGLTWIGQQLASAIAPLTGSMQRIANTLSTWASAMFQQVNVFFQGFVYLLEQVVQLAGLVVQVVLLSTQLLLSVLQGIIATFQSLATAAANPSSVNLPQLQPGFTEFRSLLDPMGFQDLGYLIAFAIWAICAVAIVNTVRDT